MRQGGLIRTCSRCAFEQKNGGEKTRNPAEPKTHPPQNAICLVLETPYMDLRAAVHTKGDISDMPSVQPTEQPRTSPLGWRGSERMPPHPSCGPLLECSVSPATTTGAARCVLSELEKLSKRDS